MMRKRAVIIYNPTSGFVRDKGGYVREMIELLAAQGVDAEARATRSAIDASAFARDAVAAGIDVVVSHGGDGTVNEVVQGMVGADVPLAVWSGGTANIVASELGLPASKEALAPIIGAGKATRIALGRVALAARDKPARSIDRYFVMVAGIGLDASVCLGVSPRLKRVGGKLAFAVTAAKHLVTWQPVPFEVDVDGRRLEGAFALVANGAGYGAPICIAPEARLTDPTFEVVVLPAHRHNVAYVRDFVACRRGGPVETSGTLLTGRRVEATSAKQVWIELDGEVVGTLPATFDVVPDALSVIVP